MFHAINILPKENNNNSSKLERIGKISITTKINIKSLMFPKQKSKSLSNIQRDHVDLLIWGNQTSLTNSNTELNPTT
jgi:hypothetical protein